MEKKDTPLTSLREPLALSDRAARLSRRLRELAAISSQAGGITRLFLTPEHIAANTLVASWMEEAGLTVQIDAVGNIIGRYEGETPDAPALMIGSHLDTVQDAGRFDGPLGVMIGIEAVDNLRRAGLRLPFSLEVVGFWDEEGVRFGGSYLGSRALSGQVLAEHLDIKDSEGITIARALEAIGLPPDRIGTASRRGAPPLAYIEVHIEQGPVLEREGLALGCVTAISGSIRAQFDVEGIAGHAGTLPMQGRRDAMAAAAECILAVEQIATDAGIVGTVGLVQSRTNAGNVVPGKVRFSIDVRDQDNDALAAAFEQLLARFTAIAARRGVMISEVVRRCSDAKACAQGIVNQISAALEANGHPPRLLQSGAGHDGIAMSELAPFGMVFVRCRQGISHNPAEHASDEDIAEAIDVLDHVIANFRSE
ncbi:allantoate amidohydrolase [Pelagibacterium sp. H642]|uniref:allantoate amidohydrolase n=1 Tax=Pelagibacterium sp. H642 TaxID=1881069 RepID=UPI002814D10C|nr:allantoate amidohydrolase [Pelagibacterium sp. H642]WMT90415.1 allantoate amidohydrolase [Pelagibacterium sp. H642]